MQGTVPGGGLFYVFVAFFSKYYILPKDTVLIISNTKKRWRHATYVRNHESSS